MSIQIYSCERDGDFEIFKQGINSVSPTEICPLCNKESIHVFRPLGRTNIKLTWNDQANEYQRNELTMVEASQKQHMRDKTERGEDVAPTIKDDLYKVAVGVQKQNKQSKKRSKFDHRTESQRNN